MGADLYIQSISDDSKAKYEPLFNQACSDRDKETDEKKKATLQKRVTFYYDRMYPVSGYFRDSYNLTSVLGRMELSWWRDVKPMLEKGFLPVEKTKEFLKMVQSKQVRPISKEECLEKGLQATIEEWNDYFEKKRKSLIKFLRFAIRKNEPIRCSL